MRFYPLLWQRLLCSCSKELAIHISALSYHYGPMNTTTKKYITLYFSEIWIENIDIDPHKLDFSDASLRLIVGPIIVIIVK